MIELCKWNIRRAVLTSFVCFPNPAATAASDTPLDYQVVANGIYSGSTNPQAVFHNGATYIGWVNSVGTIGITKYSHDGGKAESFNLSALKLEADDHDNASVYIRPDGRIVSFYSTHNDPLGVRYRISDRADDIGSWGPEKTIPKPGGYITYSNPRYLSDAGRLYIHYRHDNLQALQYSTDGGETWSPQTILFTAPSDQRPYPFSITNGKDRIDFLVTDGHPAETQTSIYHCYALWRAGELRFFTSDGTPLGLPIKPASCTRIYDGTAIDGLWRDMAYMPGGEIWVLFTRFEGAGASDHRQMFVKWTGTKWTAPVPVMASGRPLYAEQWTNSGGIVFDARDARKVYASKEEGGRWKIEEWGTDDDGASWHKRRDITTAALPGTKVARPVSPLNHDGRAVVIFWRGKYNSFIDYDTSIHAAGGTEASSLGTRQRESRQGGSVSR